MLGMRLGCAGDARQIWEHAGLLSGEAADSGRVTRTNQNGTGDGGELDCFLSLVSYDILASEVAAVRILL